MSNLSQLINHDDDYSYNYTGKTTVKVKPEAELEGEPQPSSEPIDGASEDSGVPQHTILLSFERIKTHFPAARIKKIMQSDDEIGKVAQATPIIVGRALEIFMANLVEASIIEAKKQGVKRIGASHIRAAVENTEQFDFLVEAVEKYPPVKN
ncbi:histone-fold-containing protein [Suhomyces tanzawaensis NRRL Y-17324]|uniref:Histone-fold-containing protein n=1 Tax=Suhomyces tanzawaensis NRRL Y-17324 TaxID=984487 RepID=A0A1E4SFT6_9ASCO|nr:histone-fold-containing protein [Suhomyces tanzawaensis NRRL Y-17324]ODV78374.1 histone-fold-containing protein [Suhomyces tanzawaensis NRRL Y-17324]